jgi:hypothetical protein
MKLLNYKNYSLYENLRDVSKFDLSKILEKTIANITCNEHLDLIELLLSLGAKLVNNPYYVWYIILSNINRGTDIYKCIYTIKILSKNGVNIYDNFYVNGLVGKPNILTFCLIQTKNYGCFRWIPFLIDDIGFKPNIKDGNGKTIMDSLNDEQIKTLRDLFNRGKLKIDIDQLIEFNDLGI